MSLSSRLATGTMLALLTTCLLLPCASGAVIYDEAVGGDLNGNQATPPDLGALLLGTNTIRGFNSRPTNVGPQGDGFKVAVDPLHVITSITLTISDFSGSDLSAVTLFRPSPFAVYRQVSDVSGNQVLSINVPVLTQSNELGFAIQFQNSLVPTSFSWEWNLEVAQAQQPVPEVSSVSLMAAGLAALTVWGRRRVSRRG